MKKIAAAILSAVLLCSCKPARNDSETTPEPLSDEMTSIAYTDFTQSDAERIVQAAVDEHCGSTACMVSGVRISGADITAVYTYSKDGDQKTAEVKLYDVKVKPSDRSKTEYREAEFSEKEEESPAPDDGSQEKKEYEIPNTIDEKDEHAKEDTQVYNQDGVQIYRIYMEKGTIEFTGEYTGDSRFEITVTDLKQNPKGTPVSMKKAGDIKGSMKLDKGYYYIIIDASGGWSVNWERTIGD